MAVLTMRAFCRRGWAHLRHCIVRLLVLLLLCSPFSLVSAETAPSAEYQVKAVFLFNFAQFVEWPARAFREPTAPLVIGILGEDPFGTYLDDLVNGEKIGERPLVVQRCKTEEDLAGCHIVFVCRSEAKNLEKIMAGLKGRSLLTVSDLETFTRQGGMVRFAMESGKVRLRINPDAAKACGLTISSKILRPGTVVTAGKD